MSYYKHAQRQIEKLKKNPKKREGLTIAAQMMLLAIGRECDRLGQNSIPLDDDELLRLTNEELFIHCTELSKNLLSLIAQRKVGDDEAQAFIHHSCTNSMISEDMEDFYTKYSVYYRKLKAMNPKKRAIHVQEQKAAAEYFMTVTGGNA